MAARDDAAGGTSCARRRRERRLRSMLRHERMAVAMALAEALHHSSGLEVMERAQHAALRGQKTGTRAGVAGPAPVVDYVAPAPAVAPFSAPVVSFEAPAPVVGYVAPRTCCHAMQRLLLWLVSFRACTFRHLCRASSSVRVRCARSCVRVHRTSTCCVFCCAQPTVTSCLQRSCRYFWRQP